MIHSGKRVVADPRRRLQVTGGSFSEDLLIRRSEISGIEAPPGLVFKG
jgi:hypothetical protein